MLLILLNTEKGWPSARPNYFGYVQKSIVFRLGFFVYRGLASAPLFRAFAPIELCSLCVVVARVRTQGSSISFDNPTRRNITTRTERSEPSNAIEFNSSEIEFTMNHYLCHIHCYTMAHALLYYGYTHKALAPIPDPHL